MYALLDLKMNTMKIFDKSLRKTENKQRKKV
jgi:hypothetical protein